MIGLMGTTFSGSGSPWRQPPSHEASLLVAYLLLISFLIGFKVKAKLFLNLLDQLLFLVPNLSFKNHQRRGTSASVLR
jgi:hypothetical protein